MANELRQGIIDGRYSAGSRLPAEPEFAAQAGVSRTTLRLALRQLEQEGLISRRQRRGTYVSARPFVQNSLDRNSSVADMIELSGKVCGTRDAHIDFIAPPKIAEQLELEPDAPLTVLERIRTADGRPVVLTVDYLDSRIVESASAPLLPDVSFYDWMHRHCGITVTHGLARLSAESAGEELARRLLIDEGAPVFTLLQVDYTADGRPVLHSHEFHVADAFEVSLVRKGPNA